MAGLSADIRERIERVAKNPWGLNEAMHAELAAKATIGLDDAGRERDERLDELEKGHIDCDQCDGVYHPQDVERVGDEWYCGACLAEALPNEDIGACCEECGDPHHERPHTQDNDCVNARPLASGLWQCSHCGTPWELHGYRCGESNPDDLPALALWFCKWAGWATTDQVIICDIDRNPHNLHCHAGDRCINPRPAEPVTLEVVLDVLGAKGYRGIVLAQMVEGGYGAYIYDRAPQEPEALFAGSGYGHSRTVALLNAAKAAEGGGG